MSEERPPPPPPPPPRPPRMPPCMRCGAVLPEPQLTGGRADVVCPRCGARLAVAAITATRVPVSPEEAAAQCAQLDERMRAERRAAVAQLDFPLFGLDRSWTGARSLGGWGGGRRLDHFTLTHGDPWGTTTPLVRIETHAPPTPGEAGDPNRDPRMARAMAAHRLVQDLSHATGRIPPAMTSTFTAPDPTGDWEPLTVPVAGAPVDFRALRSETQWVALGVVDDSVVAIAARAVEPHGVRLVVVDDLEPYLAGSGLPPTGHGESSDD